MLKLNEIRKEYKAYNQKELVYDVYCDRINFIGCDMFLLATYCENRNIFYWRDRSGYSIDIENKGDLPTNRATYIVNTKDLRKKAIISSY